MSIYGDIGNIIALKYRLEKAGINVVYQPVELGDKLPLKTDFYFIGGGQNKDQYNIFRDLQTNRDKLENDIENQVPLLAICGG